MPSLPANGARTVLRSICACERVDVGALMLERGLVGVELRARRSTPLATSARERAGVDARRGPCAPRGGELRALDAACRARPAPGPACTLSRTRSGWPVTMPGASLLSVDAARGRDAADGVDRRLPRLALRHRAAQRLGRRAGGLHRLAGADERGDLLGLDRAERTEEREDAEDRQDDPKDAPASALVDRGHVRERLRGWCDVLHGCPVPCAPWAVTRAEEGVQRSRSL